MELKEESTLLRHDKDALTSEHHDSKEHELKERAEMAIRVEEFESRITELEE